MGHCPNFPVTHPSPLSWDAMRKITGFVLLCCIIQSILKVETNMRMDKQATSQPVKKMSQA